MSNRSQCVPMRYMSVTMLQGQCLTVDECLRHSGRSADVATAKVPNLIGQPRLGNMVMPPYAHRTSPPSPAFTVQGGLLALKSYISIFSPL